MIKQTAVVTKAEHGTAQVKVVRESTCGQCSVQKGCGTSVFSKVLGNKFSEITVLNPVDAEAGDIVILGLAESVLVTSAMLMYLFPLLMMFGGAMVIVMLNNWLGFELGQLWVIAASFSGLIVAYRIIKRVSSRHSNNKKFQPVILSKATLSEMKASQFPVEVV